VEANEIKTATRADIARVSSEREDQYVYLAKAEKRIEWLKYRKDIIDRQIAAAKRMKDALTETIIADAAADRDKTPAKTVSYPGLGSVTFRKSSGKLTVDKTFITDVEEAGALSEAIELGIVTEKTSLEVGKAALKKVIVTRDANVSEALEEIIDKHATVDDSESVTVKLEDAETLASLQPMYAPRLASGTGENTAALVEETL